MVSSFKWLQLFIADYNLSINIIAIKMKNNYMKIPPLSVLYEQKVDF